MINCAFHIALKIYTAPDSHAAAEMAWHDASLSHIKNGIYEAMFIATMLARAAVSTDIADVIQSGLSEIPHTSSLYKSISEMF